jgi:hypothetical protein
MTEESIVGDLINFRGLVYAPLNEQGVVFLFGKVAHDLNMYVEEIKSGFPDCIGRRYVGKGWQRVRIEFEYRSSNFLTHTHPKDGCDIIVCWKHDWRGCPLEVIELSSEIRGMKNPPIEHPGAVDPDVKNAEAKLDAILEKLAAKPEVKRWYTSLLDGVRKVDSEIWAKVGEKYAGWYCPERAFVSLQPSKTSIQIECFSRGLLLEGTKVSNVKFAPRWAKFTIKSEADAQKAVEILTASYKRIKEAIKLGEQTSYFSGGQDFSSGSGEAKGDES